MDCVKSNNDIILFAQPNKIIGRKIIGTTECGKWNICLTKILVHKRIYLVIPVISINIIMKQQAYNMRYMRWCHS